MPSLKKPEICSKCGSGEFRHLFKPEKWVCVGCDHAESERPAKNDQTKCRKCGVSRQSKNFKKDSNICVECQSKYNKAYRDINSEALKQYRQIDYQRNKKKRQISVRRSIQRSPESFLRSLIHHLTKQSNQVRNRRSRLNRNRQEALITMSLTYDDLLSLYESQHGLCALTQLPMTHQFNDLCSISVDRIDSKLGYVSGNIQLVCKWVNLAKQKHTNTEFVGMLDKLRSVFNVT